MNLVNKTSTITVAVVAALVALVIAAHLSGAIRLSPVHAARPGDRAGDGVRRREAWAGASLAR
jgi:hypothetical protein